MARILVVGMVDSVHLARWLSIFENEGHDFLILPSSPSRRIHRGIQRLLLGGHASRYRLLFKGRYWGVLLWAFDVLLRDRVRAGLLRRAARAFQPEIVHALELQHAGYICLAAFEKSGLRASTLMLTNYGSDLFWFSRFPYHQARLRRLLALADRYAAECSRDVKLATSLGFQGQVMPVLPNAGGFEIGELPEGTIRPSDRSLIMVKGYQGWVGRAHVALEAIEMLASELTKYEIVVYSCNFSTKRRALELAKRTGLKVTAYSKGALSHDEMLERFSRSLVYIGLSLSDGISTSMLEAMALGSIPLQTSTACCDEWFSDTGVALDKIAVQDVAQGIQRAIELALTTDSATKNREIIRARASRDEITERALSFYRT